jgi:hypothetical protein
MGHRKLIGRLIIRQVPLKPVRRQRTKAKGKWRAIEVREVEVIDNASTSASEVLSGSKRKAVDIDGINEAGGASAPNEPMQGL